MIAELRALEKRGAWAEVAALFPQVTEPVRAAFVKALRRTDAVAHAVRAIETQPLLAITVLRVMKPQGAPLHVPLASPDVAVRREAALAAHAVPMHAALREALLVALFDEDRLVRAYALSALRRVLDAEIRHALQQRLDVETDDVIRDDLDYLLC